MLQRAVCQNEGVVLKFKDVQVFLMVVAGAIALNARKFMRSHPRLIALAVAVLVGFGSVTMTVPTATAATGRVYVALGDSFASGTGSGTFRAEDKTVYAAGTSDDGNHCYRSRNAYPVLVAAAKSFQLINATCSGAFASDILNDTTRTYNGKTFLVPAQIKSVPSNADVVTITITGNDIGFIPILTCIIASFPCTTADDSVVAGYNNLMSVTSKAASVLQAVHAKAPNARVYITGYPQLVPLAGQVQAGCPFADNSEQGLANDLEQKVNGAIRDAANTNDATFVDVYNPPSAFKTTPRSDACSVLPNRKLNGIVALFVDATFHPNMQGQQAYASDVGAAIS